MVPWHWCGKLLNAVPEVIVHPVAPSSNLGFATQVRGDEERGDGERGRGLGGGGLGECGGGEGLSGGGKGLMSPQLL